MVEYRREREAERGSCPTERDGSEEAKVVKNRLGWEACLPPRDMVFVWSWAAVMGHVWVHGPTTDIVHDDVHAPVTIEGCEDAWGWGCHV